MAFFWSAFLSSAKTASIVGYVLAMFVTICAGSLNAIIWPSVGDYPYYANVYPAFSFARCVFNLTSACAGDGCVNKLSMVSHETWVCVGMMLGVGMFYGLMGAYLNEILK